MMCWLTELQSLVHFSCFACEWIGCEIAVRDEQEGGFHSSSALFSLLPILKLFLSQTELEMRAVEHWVTWVRILTQDKEAAGLRGFSLIPPMQGYCMGLYNAMSHPPLHVQLLSQVIIGSTPTFHDILQHSSPHSRLRWCRWKKAGGLATRLNWLSPLLWAFRETVIFPGHLLSDMSWSSFFLCMLLSEIFLQFRPFH